MMKSHLSCRENSTTVLQNQNFTFGCVSVRSHITYDDRKEEKRDKHRVTKFWTI